MIGEAGARQAMTRAIASASDLRFIVDAETRGTLDETVEAAKTFLPGRVRSVVAQGHQHRQQHPGMEGTLGLLEPGFYVTYIPFDTACGKELLRLEATVAR
jgi:hypothetical protein